jgi:superfamily I DNA and RNA helicase
MVQPVLSLPGISRSDFNSKFGHCSIPEQISVIWEDGDVSSAVLESPTTLDRVQWRLAKSIFQGVNPLNSGLLFREETSDSLGGAIKILEREIALLDDEQHKVAVQIAPGPQRIRGLAGTGKTVVLAMKAANIHLRYPEARVLFTFNTQSLYPQAKQLISKFYRVHSDADPDWEKIQIRHGWGGSSRPGVYSDICKRAGEVPLTFSQAKAINNQVPFQACCKKAFNHVTFPEYDYILVDEAQDFPKEFFRLLIKLATPEHRICWAYDELQSLSAIEIPSATDLFGLDESGQARVNIEGEDYPGNIEKDFVLHRSYRCPQQVLMLAHGIGLGIHAPNGCVQMLGNAASWNSIGYEITAEELVIGKEISIYRPPINSPNRVSKIYAGDKEIVQVKSFTTRSDELHWVSRSIANDIESDHVKPEQIVVICLDMRSSKKYLMEIQTLLRESGVASIIPGLINSSDEFAEPGRVTLSTIYRAKGNEAPVVYVIGFDHLYSYVEEIENRNRAFTSITRSKGWLRLSGCGANMEKASQEISRIMQDIPYFKFVYQGIEGIRCLDASETSRRRRDVRRASDSIKNLLQIDKEALKDLDPMILDQLKEVLSDSGNA